MTDRATRSRATRSRAIRSRAIRSRATRAAWLAGAVGAALLATGCGGGEAPSAAAPGSGGQLPATAATSGPSDPAPTGPAASGPAATGPAATGSGDAAADQLVERARAALAGVRRLQVTGTVAQRSGPDAGDPVDLDLALERGVGSRGQVVVAGLPLEVAAFDGTVYTKVTDQLIEAQQLPGPARLLIGRWVALPADRAGAFAQVADVDAFTAALLPAGPATRGPTRDVAGRPAVAVDSSAGRVWIVTEGDPLPLRVEPAGSAVDEALTLAYADVAVQRPAPAEIVDVSGLTGG